MANPMQNPDYAMWAGLNNKVIPFPASGIPPRQPPKPDYGLKENKPGITPISGRAPGGVPGTATRPSYPPQMGRGPSTDPSQLPPTATKPAPAAPRPPAKVDYGLKENQWQPAPRPPQNPWQQYGTPQGWGQVRPAQGFGGGGYPQLPGGMQQPPWMQYYQNPSGGAGMGFGGGMQMPMGAQNGYQNFQNQYQNPFAGYYINRPTYQPMPTLPTTPGAPNMPNYYRPGAMPSGW